MLPKPVVQICELAIFLMQEMLPCLYFIITCCDSEFESVNLNVNVHGEVMCYLFFIL